ncbi:CapA family protein [Mastigocoleus sp. MO_188.B34]|uniref:CapA family protein n=1 Tax=Mastigocoleus sp. MO_188.B34 TaxID=3036635 RepID=UPI00260D19EF|nr:CapA family protein [Mastigocoleus sp. MO_188.B34]MDJ0692832.1 CapA family protein [Mastigocoleus sp. MO_188.B34]
MTTNHHFKKILSFSFIVFCFCTGIGIGIFIRFGRIQTLEAATTSPVLNQINSSDTPGSTEPFSPSLQKQLIVDPQNTTQNITIQAVGDIIPGTNYPNYRLPKNRNQLFPQSVRRYLQRADLLFGNFESTLTNHKYSSKDISRGQVFAFRSPPTYAKLFKDVGFDVFNIANNHALDFGMVGLKDTVNHLKSVGIETVGHKNQILILEVNNVKVAMLGFAPYKFYNSIHDLKAAEKLVKTAKQKADIVIVSMHAGAEGTGALRVRNQTEFFYGENRGNPIKFARQMIDVGADIVLGHGPHVPRAMEIYKDKLIAYSLGNFLGYKTLSTRAQTGYSMILETKIDREGKLLGAKIIPVHLNSQGIPYIDQNFRTVGLLRYLINKDFPQTPVKIDKKGAIVLANAER